MKAPTLTCTETELTLEEYEVFLATKAALRRLRAEGRRHSKGGK